jgi:Peptidase MA superfamily
VSGRLAAGGILLLGMLAAAPVVQAAGPTFGRATATATFLQSIAVEQQVTLPGGVHRIESYVRATGDARTYLADVPNPGPGDHKLSYTYPTPSGGLYPNTRVELGFRVTLDDGSVIDSPPAKVRYDDTRYAWNTLEGELVRVHWYAGNDAFGRRALQIGEKAVKDAAELLGVTETDPIDYFVYADTDAFYDVLGPAIRENVGGIALPEIRTLFANIPPSAVDDPWVGIVVPHELTHLVFATATDNPYHSPPHWMNEGLAVYLAQGYDPGSRGNVERAARDGEIMPIQALVGQFPTTAERFGLAYDESVSAIDYLIRTYGQDALVRLIRSYADGVSDDGAFTTALGVDVDAFETGWLADLGLEEPPVAFGPVAAPPGPLPPGWTAPPVVVPSGSVPGASAKPRSSAPGSSVEPIVLVAIGVLAVTLLVAGLAVVARNLGRGEPLLPPLGRGELPDVGAAREEAAGDESPELNARDDEPRDGDRRDGVPRHGEPPDVDPRDDEPPVPDR